jgi:hypothetical protein
MSLAYYLGTALLPLLFLLAALAVGHRRTSRALARIALEQASLRYAAREDAVLKTQASDARHAALLEMLCELRTSVKDAEARQQQRSLDQLSAALAGVIADFNQRIMGEFDAQLRTLSGVADRTQELYRKQRNEQMEAMHHARRVAERMEQATQDFGKLVADSSTLAALAADVRESLALLGPRQEAIDSGVAQQAQSLQAMADAIADLRAGFDVATEQLLTQSRRAFDSMGQRAAQSNSALNKELNEALAKAMSGMSKQLTTMSSRLTTDMAPMAQQLKRVTEQSRIAR